MQIPCVVDKLNTATCYLKIALLALLCCKTVLADFGPQIWITQYNLLHRGIISIVKLFWYSNCTPKARILFPALLSAMEQRSVDAVLSQNASQGLGVPGPGGPRNVAEAGAAFVVCGCNRPSLLTEHILLRPCKHTIFYWTEFTAG